MSRWALMATLVLSACAPLPPLPEWQAPDGRDDEALGRILDLRDGSHLTPAELVERLAAAPRVLVGEQHDNPDHHALEQWLLRALETRRPQGGVLLEMLVPAQQAPVDAAREAFARGQPPAELERALAWQKGWDWALYGPLVRYALTRPYPLMAANLDRSEVMDIYERRPSLAGRVSTAGPVRDALRAQIRDAHCGLLPEDQLPAMLAVQQQRDRRMAERLLAAPEPALLFAGAYHVRRDLGVPLHARDLRPGAREVVVILSEVGKEVSPQAADYVWYTAAVPEQDHCAALRP